MEAGKLRHRITIKQKTVVRDEFGGEQITWTALYTVWSEVMPLSGAEVVRFGLEEAEATVRVRMRYRSGIMPKMIVSWGDRTFDILATSNRYERNKELWLECREIVD